MKKSVLFLVALVFLWHCSEDSSSSNNGGSITTGPLAQVYTGSVKFELSGGFTATYESDTSTATAITQENGKDHYITLYEEYFGIAFVGLTEGSNASLKFVDSTTVLPGEIIGTLNSMDVLVISQSGTFNIQTLNSDNFRGTFSGVFEGFQHSNSQSVTVNINGTFNYTRMSFGKSVADEQLNSRRTLQETVRRMK